MADLGKCTTLYSGPIRSTGLKVAAIPTGLRRKGRTINLRVPFFDTPFGVGARQRQRSAARGLSSFLSAADSRLT